MMTKTQLYWRLMRLDKPIGILLLLWPTLWGLVWAHKSSGLWTWQTIRWDVVVVFIAGTVLMRSAGCVINDYADKDFDRHVARTAHRPITSGLVSPREALWLTLVLVVLAAGLLLFLNPLTWGLAVVAAILAGSYPFFKRFFALPQAYLGIAFGFGIPMAFAAITGYVPAQAWGLLLANVFWTLAYDTEYAMVDKADDLKIGIKTAAITFGQWDVAAVMTCYGIFLAMMAFLGGMAGWGGGYFLLLAGAAMIALYHYRLIYQRDSAQCFAAFLHNQWLGLMVFLGVLLA